MGEERDLDDEEGMKEEEDDEAGEEEDHTHRNASSPPWESQAERQMAFSYVRMGQNSGPFKMRDSDTQTISRPRGAVTARNLKPCQNGERGEECRKRLDKAYPTISPLLEKSDRSKTS
jgi:hypothetical protein